MPSSINCSCSRYQKIDGRAQVVISNEGRSLSRKLDERLGPPMKPPPVKSLPVLLLLPAELNPEERLSLPLPDDDDDAASCGAWTRIVYSRSTCSPWLTICGNGISQIQSGRPSASKVPDIASIEPAATLSSE